MIAWWWISVASQPLDILSNVVFERHSIVNDLRNVRLAGALIILSLVLDVKT